MELEFFGGNCFRVKTKSTVLVIDDNLNSLGKKSIVTDKTAVFYSAEHLKDAKAIATARLTIDTAGEFEVGDVTVKAVQARAHVDGDGEHTATVFQMMHGGQTISFLGHVHPNVSDEVIELISGTDVLVLPVGGNGYTLDPVGATSIIKKVEPDVIVPAQYDIAGLTYEVPAQPLSEFAKVASMSIEDVQDSLKLTRASEDATSQTHIVVLQVK